MKALDACRRRRSRPALLAMGASLMPLLLAGCHKKPGGQVVAVVGGDEITQPELRAEADAAQVPPDADLQSYAPAILQRVIERNLLAQHARDEKLDRGPEYIGRRRQLEQALLANLALKKIAAAQPAPTAGEVQAFIRANPATFDQRQKLTLDQVRFPTPSDLKQIKVLESAGSLDAVQGKLLAGHVQVARGKATLDTGTLETQVARQIVALPNGRLFDVTVNRVTFVSAIIGREPILGASENQEAKASTLLQRERVQKAMAAEMARLRAGAKITYDPAFQPQTAPR